MSEVITNKYLDFGGLKKYDELIKVFIANGNKELADAISALNDKIGSLEIEGSDDKTIAEAIAEIYASIEEIVVKQGALEDKDAELEGKDAELLAQINGIIGELEEGATAMTLVEIANKFKTVEEGIEKNAGDIAGVDTRLTTLEETVRNLGEIEGGESLGDIVNKVNTNADNIATLQGAVETLNGEGEGSVKKTAEDAAAAAEEAAKEYADSLVMDGENPRFDAAGSAAQALEDAKAYADEKAGAAEDVADEAKGIAGEAKEAAEGAVEVANQANATATEAKGIAESASSTAGTAQTTANEAAATASTAATTAGEAKEAAEGAVSVADEAKDIADDAAAVANEANEAAKANADSIKGLDERLADVEGISNAAEVKYEDGFIKLYDKDGNAIGEGFSAADFVVDGMLESVAFKEVDGVKTNVLVFTFNTDHGADDVEIDFSKYVDVYHADETSLTLNSDSKTFSVKEVAANKTKLGQKITIAGGPLANNIAESGEVWPSKWTNGTEKFIPEDATMYDIVMNLFCVEKWPVKSNGSSNVSTSDATLVSKMDTPTLTYNGKTANNNSTTVEVGTTVSYEAKSGKSDYTATPHKASGFTYGYADANDDVKDSANTEKSASFGTISAVTDSVPTLTLSGKVSETINGTAATATAGTASKSGSVVIALGDNKIKAQGKSIAYTGTCSALPVYYGCSNLGNTNNDGTTYPSTEKAEKTLTSTAVNSGTIEINCVGAYQVFVGYTAEVPTTSAGVRAMNNNNRLGKGSCGTTDTVYTINNNYMVVAVPTGWDFTIQNDLGQADQRNSFAKSDATVAVELPNHTEEVPSTVSYDIWSIGWSGGAYKNLIIK